MGTKKNENGGGRTGTRPERENEREIGGKG